MVWNNGPMVVYHGTDALSGNNIRLNGIQRARFNPLSDFGPGFYVTTALHQARNWANERVRTLGGTGSAELLVYSLDRTAINNLDYLAFVTDTQDYHEFVDFCWGQNVPVHSRAAPYDAVYGPVSLWPQTLVIANCDQICFTDPLAVVDAAGNSLFAQPSQTIRSFPNTYF